MIANLLPFLAGAVSMGFGLCGLAFLRLWVRSRDRFFLAFAGAFWLLMLPALSFLLELPDESDGSIYLFRVAAYVLIIAAVIVKNRQRLGRFARGGQPHR